MSEETNVAEPTIENTETTNEVSEQPLEQKTFSQAQLNSILESRVMAERRKYEKILAVASTNKAVVPEQIVSLLKSELQLADDGRVEVLDNNRNIRYNEKGQPLTVEDRVKEFLDTNPHFRQGSLSGSGSQSSIGGNSLKPKSIGDLDLNNPADRKLYKEMRNTRSEFKLNPKLTINN